uniref:Candidate secreted effector n=1 Tax=Meloidogyne incognita TaxID=6306 RepID=A0A914N5W8_MELIC
MTAWTLNVVEEQIVCGDDHIHTHHRLLHSHLHHLRSLLRHHHYCNRLLRLHSHHHHLRSLLRHHHYCNH